MSNEIQASAVGLGNMIGGFLAAIFSNFVSLGFWMPFGLAGIMLLISGPSMIIAWLKLRQRTLGPILEGNGWAVNGRVRINIPLGSALTDVAALPAGARRSLDDPYEDREAASRRRRLIFWLIVAALAALTALLEPLLILVMGAIVLLIVLAVMLPIIEINQLVR